MGRSAAILRLGSRTMWAIVIVVAMASWTETAGAQPAKKVTFKKGQIQFQMGGKSFSFPLGPGPDAGALQTEVPIGATKPESTLFLIYGDAGAGGDGATMQLSGLSGPARYGKGNIYHFDLRAGPNVWEGKDCTFAFTRLDASGVAGTATCTAAGGKAPFTDMTFSAAPS